MATSTVLRNLGNPRFLPKCGVTISTVSNEKMYTTYTDQSPVHAASQHKKDYKKAREMHKGNCYTSLSPSRYREY